MHAVVLLKNAGPTWLFFQGVEYLIDFK